MLSCFYIAAVKHERVLELIQDRLFMDKCQQDVTLTISSICTQPSLSSFPLTELDLTACVRNSGILHSSLSSHSSVHKPGPLLCVHTFVPVHVKFISRRRKNNNFTDWISCNYIYKYSTSYIIQSLKCEDPPSYAGSAPRPNSSPLSTHQPPLQIHIPTH